MLQPYTTKEYLQKEYSYKRRNTVEIAQDWGVRPCTISYHLKKWNIPIRKAGERGIKDKTGKRYGRLIAIKSLGNINRRYYWECRCDCGAVVTVSTSHLTTGHTQSCGCYKSDMTSCKTYQGGQYITGEEFNSVYRGAKQRNIDFHITIEEVENLYEQQNKCCALSGRPIDFNKRRIAHIQGKIIRGSASIDRIDSHKPYTIDNIQLLHKEVNMAKQRLAQKDFIQLCREVANYA